MRIYQEKVDHVLVVEDNAKSRRIEVDPVTVHGVARAILSDFQPFRTGLVAPASIVYRFHQDFIADREGDAQVCDTDVTLWLGRQLQGPRKQTFGFVPAS